MCCCIFIVFFFFKQKTAYEMRISDWSSDVCSSDLRWDVDAAKALKLTSVDMPKLAGCYCINNSCGTNLAWGNMASVLRDLGGGMIGALTTADPRYGVAEAVIDGPAIRYVGAQSTACQSSPNLSQTRPEESTPEHKSIMRI